MGFIKIVNKGLIQTEDLTLIGSSTKRGDDDKIGMFGSGWKYALAWLFRNDCVPFIFSGVRQVKLEARLVSHRDNLVNVITVDNTMTSLTTDMGPQWEAWMALREIISNAIDEGEHSIEVVDMIQETHVNNDITTIYIPINVALSEIMVNYSNYFSFNKKASYVVPDVGEVYLNSEIQETKVYRKGIKCYNNPYGVKSFLDFNFYNININESRLTTYNDVISGISRLFSKQVAPYEIFKKLVLSQAKEYLPRVSVLNSLYLPYVKQMVSEGYTFTSQKMQKLLGSFGNSNSDIVVTDYWLESLISNGIVESKFENLFSNNRPTFIPVTMTEVMKATQKGIEYYLKSDDFDIRFATFTNKSTLSHVELELSGLGIKEIVVSADKPAVKIAASIIKQLPLNHIQHILDY